MDLNEYWQENRGFVTQVACGAVAFVLALVAVDAVYGEEIAALRRTKVSLERDLGESMFGRAELSDAQADAEELATAEEVLRERVAFRPRERFVLDARHGSPSNQYHRVVAEVREELLEASGRGNLRLDATLGLPKLSPTRREEIERHLEALDLVERAVRLALGARVERLEEISVRLDPGLYSRSGVGRVERTRVKLVARGAPLGLVRWMEDLQDPARGGPALVEEAQMALSRGRDDEGRLEIELVVARLHDPEGTEDLP